LPYLCLQTANTYFLIAGNTNGATNTNSNRSADSLTIITTDRHTIDNANFTAVEQADNPTYS
jgi:hypothetical protein